MDHCRTAGHCLPARRRHQADRAQGETGRRPGGGWTGDASVGFVKTLGVLEVLAAAGLLLPAALDVAPILVPATAVCLVLLMVGAMITHLRRNEAKPVVANLAYLALAAFVAWGRFGPESFIG